MTNSLALLSDAGHMLSDSISLFAGVIAFVLGEKVANHRKTYVVADRNLTVAQSQKLLCTIEHKVENKGIGHVTIQLETEDRPHGNSLLYNMKYAQALHHHSR